MNCFLLYNVKLEYVLKSVASQLVLYHLKVKVYFELLYFTTSSCAMWNGLRIEVGGVADASVSMEDRSVVGVIRLHNMLYDVLIGLE